MYRDTGSWKVNLNRVSVVATTVAGTAQFIPATWAQHKFWLFKFLSDWQFLIIVISIGLAAVCSFTTLFVISRLKFIALHSLFNALRTSLFSAAGNLEHEHRVTLYKFYKKPWYYFMFKKDLKGTLKPVFRSGNHINGTIRSWKLYHSGENPHSGIVGRAHLCGYAQTFVHSVAKGPVTDDEYKQYADATLMTHADAKTRYGGNVRPPLFIHAQPFTLHAADSWGVLVLDSTNLLTLGILKKLHLGSKLQIFTDAVASILREGSS